MADFIDTTISDENKQKAKQKRDRELSDIRKIVSMPEGRRFIWRVLSEAGIFRSSFTGSSSTFFLEGSRNQGLWVLRDLTEAKSDAFNQMLQENYSEIKSYQVKREE